MPDPGGAEHLLAYLWEMGPTVPAGPSVGPVTFQEMRAWSEVTGVFLEPWEYRTLRRLSADYLAELQRASKHDAIAPTRQGEPETGEQKRLRAKQMDRALSRFLDD